MRTALLAAVALLAIAACSKPTELSSSDNAATTPVETTAAPAAAPEAAADHGAGHTMPAMDDTMKSADAADDANTAETPDGHTFHTYPAKTESVHLPAATGGSWTATASDAALVEVGAAADEAMPDGVTHHVVKVTPKASGNATVKFERRETADAAAPVVETRTINFMVH